MSSFGSGAPSSNFNFFVNPNNNEVNNYKNLAAKPDPTITNKKQNRSNFKSNGTKPTFKKSFKQKNAPIITNKSLNDNNNNNNPPTVTHKKFLMNQSSKEQDFIVGSLLPNPETFGFKRSHQQKRKPRELPRFLITQQPDLKPRPFIQDPWDRENQKKMSQLEESIDDVTELYETLKKMRETERKIMEDKGLVDKADFAKDLNDAIVFQGSCEDMCPIFERSRRTVERALFSYEKDYPTAKKASKTKALKVFARPAAAAAPPLPSDVRPPHVLVKSLDYIVDNLLTSLPESESFLWDRMRSIRQDFTYQNYCGPEAVDCNERIVRIHLLILHVMTKSTVEFSLQQELEQLHKSLITLSEIYDDVRNSGGTCPNEAEFRAYTLLSKVRDPQYDKNIQELPDHIFQDDLVQLAICFRRIISNSNFIERGYIRTENCLNLYARFFQLMKSDKVPVLMNSFLQMYLTEVRFYAMKAISPCLNKRHKPIPTSYFLELLVFNDEKELLEFCDYYSINVVDNGLDLRSLTHHSHKIPEKKPLKQSYLDCVEKKLNRVTYSQLINSGKPNIDNIPQITSAFITPIVANEAPTTSKAVPTQLPPKENFFLTSSQPFQKSDSLSTLRKDEFLISAVPSTNLQSSTLGNINLESPPSFNLDTGTTSKPIITTETNNMSRAPALNVVPLGNEPRIVPLKEEDEEKIYKQNQQQKQEEKAKLLKQRALEKEMKQKEIKEQACKALTSEIVQNVVHNLVGTVVQKCINETNKKKAIVDNISEDLYHAFLHERLFLIYLDSKAETYREQRLKSTSFAKWNEVLKKKIKEEQAVEKKKKELTLVGKQLGVPIFKRAKHIINTPSTRINSSFLRSPSIAGNITFSPVVNETNKFSNRQQKNEDLWKTLNLRDIFLSHLVKNLPDNKKAKLDTILYATDWSSVPNSWLLSKFGMKDPGSEVTLQDGNATLTFKSMNNANTCSHLKDIHLLVFNTGVTNSEIFDLEMKLKQDGENLSKLLAMLSRNNNISFNILFLYWESAETPLADDLISKYLKLDRIKKIYGNNIEESVLVRVTDNAPCKMLERGLVFCSQNFKYKLTEIGKRTKMLKNNRSLIGTNSKVATEKMRSMLKLERNKQIEIENKSKGTYNHLKGHILASPKVQKRKLSILSSEVKHPKFRTPSANLTFNSSSPPLPSHLAVKFRKRGGRISNSTGLLPPSTPSYSTNFPHTSSNDQHTPITRMITEHKAVSSISSRFTGVPEPNMFQTPINSIATPNNLAPPSKGENSPLPENLQELKSLIETVKKKINGQ
ncbi:Sac3p NDAI_0J00880 [Naumovozyma dairenensis CBS 421]|uniref:Nuclear mRNA export factor n=1 Tax=Naumovozyma dairenensis (strain ATCC 10597 / BCRC 20456 / CBS 421 / NBRC 0211 / NRRL Y-12639) TaxID=1071378 RepID=G0WGQ2_NAUDC|nr:hypothetical protein NDAI_0J00880 [Naumovozyma dairenensis CBS 421]CCD26980.1 hypothetical protein NDAI_0J00880 [Naumovozyma dairenensis CBS 421]